jgi:hypothetical protein
VAGDLCTDLDAPSLVKSRQEVPGIQPLHQPIREDANEILTDCEAQTVFRQRHRRCKLTEPQDHFMRKTLDVLVVIALLALPNQPARAADRVRVEATGTLWNDGFFNDEDVKTWSPGGDLHIAIPLACWTSVGIGSGYQLVQRSAMFAPSQPQPRKIASFWLEWSAYAPVIQDRLELGGRVSLGRAVAFTSELNGGIGAAISATALYWLTDWLGVTAELGGSMNIFSTPDNDPDGSRPEGLGLITGKIGAVARF